jgi:uncharacterized protein (TIGR00369 family)
MIGASTAAGRSERISAGGSSTFCSPAGMSNWIMGRGGSGEVCASARRTRCSSTADIRPVYRPYNVRMAQSAFYDAVRATFVKAVPHVAECGMQIVDVGPDGASVDLPYRPEFLGDPERGLIHTGIITAVIDTTCGVALLGALGRFEPIATLDLRVDYLRPARPGATLHTRAQCYRLTRHIAFLRAWAWQDDEAQPVAVSQSTFMRSSHSRARAI